MKNRTSALDFKLGFRMLLRYPGLTLVGGLAFAFAIWMGAGAFELISHVINPRLPLEQGSRIVGINAVNRASTEVEAPTLHDFTAWSAGLRTVSDLGAFRTLERNLISGDGVGEPVEVAEISASAFRVARVPPLMGRHLIAADERPDAAPVALIGYNVWRLRFNGDPGIVGRQVRLGREVHTVVGVMPEDFAFPVSQSLWVPLRLDPLAFRPGEAPRVRVFGRLAPGASLPEAQAEVAAVGERMARDAPETHGQLRPRLLPYARSIINLDMLAIAAVGGSNLFLVVLVVLICGNVALLMFARAASRERELVVRSALGATRGRIIGQLFAEALVLAGVGALLGLAAVQMGLRWAFRSLLPEFGDVPFWIRPTLSLPTVLYAVLLTLLAAVVAGVVPGLKVTRGLRAQLQQASAGAGGFRFGGIWTAVLVAQITVTVVFPAVAFRVRADAAKINTLDLGFPDEQFLSARVEMDQPPPGGGVSREARREAHLARYAETMQRLRERVAEDPAVESVTFGERLPRMYHPYRLVDIDPGGAAPLHPSWPAYRVSSASVEPEFFQTFQAPILAGRGFNSGDAQAQARVVIVNESFVRNVLGGRNPIGRRIRYRHFEEWEDPTPPQNEPWYEIVGVVRDLGFTIINDDDPKLAGFYHPVAPGGAYPGHLALRMRGDPASFAPRLRAIATRLEPDLRLYDVQPLDKVNTAEAQFYSFWVTMTALVSGVAMFLSLAGIYAVMSFTVGQRTREIGIRVALGGTAEHVIRAVFRRPLTQIGLGIVIGAVVTGLLLSVTEGGRFNLTTAALLAAYTLVMTAVCLLACIVPTRRALAVEPTTALRAEG